MATLTPEPHRFSLYLNLCMGADLDQSLSISNRLEGIIQIFEQQFEAEKSPAIIGDLNSTVQELVNWVADSDYPEADLNELGFENQADFEQRLRKILESFPTQQFAVVYWCVEYDRQVLVYCI